MLYFQGDSYYTQFRLGKLQSLLNQHTDALSAISAHYAFFVDLQAELDQSQLQDLSQLLRESECQSLPKASHDLVFWVVPRLGTISPWSSKATDILHTCGLDTVLRVEHGVLYRLSGVTIDHPNIAQILRTCHDPLTESVVMPGGNLSAIFLHQQPRPLKRVKIADIKHANTLMGLALSELEVKYLSTLYKQLNRDPTDAELMMFAQVNSEHCRHKIFNATWWVDGKKKKESLFDMIRHTYKTNPDQAIVAYSDNAAVLKGYDANRLALGPEDKIYSERSEATGIVLKVETHNHPTAISPFAGAATGSGGEIRDEAATGRGAYSKAGLCGFSVSHLRIPEYDQPWEINIGRPSNMASPLSIMLEGPIGAASFNNEFGRPNICGYFRSFEMQVDGYYGKEYRGYHKPIMIAGGMGAIRHSLIEKKDIEPGAKLVILGGPGMAIGLGGGAASSRESGEGQEALDFASVQRANPEMQRRCQQVITACCEMGADTPILSIHDVGAGGISNAMPELVEASNKGALLDLRKVLIDEPGMTPLEIWCNESQERFVMAIHADSVSLFEKICARERCPFAVVGEATDHEQLVVADDHFKENPIDLSMPALFEKMPGMVRETEHAGVVHPAFNYKDISIADALLRVLRFPAVANKNFLITIGDRSVGGLVSRDQMVGPWQVPVSDVAVTTTDFSSHTGEAMAMGERAPIAVLHPTASARMAVGEAITNIAAAPIEDISKIALSANWMAAPNELGEGAALFDAVQAIGKELCPSLGISIPVGKDSLSMQTSWQDDGNKKSVVSPLSLVITASAPVSDVRAVLTPMLNKELKNSRLLLIDLGDGCNALGGSVFAQTYQKIGEQPPDVDNSNLLKQFFHAIQSLNQKGLIHAYHDRSDGGLVTTISEMMFASHAGVTLDITALNGDVLPLLFSEELGAVVQIDMADFKTVMDLLDEFGLREKTNVIAELNDHDDLLIVKNSRQLYQQTRMNLQSVWSETSYRMQRLRDNPDCADAEYENLLDPHDPGLNVALSFDLKAPVPTFKNKPRVAILREQGVNGHMEMAAAFLTAGFEPVDVHMTDLLTGRVSLSDFVGLAVCGGFSYGDVLGAGRGWANSILMHDELRDRFSGFFRRKDTFTLGVCNGCQMLSQLKSIIPGADAWPSFQRNHSEQFEARLSLVKIEQTPSIFFKDMAGSVIPIVTSHGEGRAVFGNIGDVSVAGRESLIAMRYVDPYHEPTTRYPFNPNGSHQGITALTTPNGRVLAMMPHPERVFRAAQLSWSPKEWGDDSPWLRMFQNARSFVG